MARHRRVQASQPALAATHGAHHSGGCPYRRARRVRPSQRVDLADAVAASCSSGRPYRIGNNHYIDGGYRRNENADLAAGCERVLVLSPFSGRTLHPLEWGMQLAAQVDELRAHGSRVETIFPSSDAEHLFGANAMDPSTRPPAARAGHDQGVALAEHLSVFWS